tara:strand:+ start:734 stop:952 length:219 start_codon:yes stop_codon:yes gene_type:complete
MTPKEKAEQLVSKFITINLSQVNELVDGIRIRLAKESALIAVDEVTTYLEDILVPNPFGQYWQEVRKEIENL